MGVSLSFPSFLTLTCSDSSRFRPLKRRTHVSGSNCTRSTWMVRFRRILLLVVEPVALSLTTLRNVVVRTRSPSLIKL